MNPELSAVARLAFACLTILLAQSALWAPNAPPALSVGLAALATVSWWRPAWGLIALAVLAPLGRLIAIVWLGGYPIRGTEAMALAVLAGVALRLVARRPDSPALPSRVSGPWMLYGAATIASAAVLWRYSQFHQSDPTAFFGRLIAHLATGFHSAPGEPRLWMSTAGFGYVDAAVLVLEGIAVMLVTARWCAITPGLARRITIASVVTGASIAVLSPWMVVEAALATDRPWEMLPELVVDGRWTYHVNKVNTAASYFVLIAALAVGLFANEGRARWRWGTATLLLGAALWLTASLAAILSGAAVLAAVLTYRIVRTAGANRRLVMVTAALLLLVVGVTAVRTATRDRSMRSLELRWAIARVSLDTAAEGPLFGVGIGTYPLRSAPHQTDFVREGYGDIGLQPHNILLQNLAELGVVGMALLIWALAVTFLPALKARSTPAGRWAVPAALGTLAFLLSSLSGQPMLVDSVAIPAWMVMGLALTAVPLTTARAVPARWVLVGIAIIGLTVPFRMAREVDGADPRGVGRRTTTEQDSSGLTLHYLDGEARLFVRRSAVAIRIHAEATAATRTGELFLEVAAPGVRVRPLALVPGARRTVCVMVDTDALGSSGFRAIEVAAVTESGNPAPRGAAWAAVEGLEQPCAVPSR